ncbi:maleylpyruvate isomerase family mycothiol-dependent enzyme [Streptomyces sp. NPDC059881]|uniref:maleylpyruvate isomerase family mycothiol-dependent enzyme n=1 Tax=Streptomyces sp. NPDC059881 TaxID=3346986 RepID=UPI00364B58E0
MTAAAGQERQETEGTLPEGLGDAIRDTAEEIAALLHGSADTGVPVPGSRWTLGEAAAHLAQANALMADLAAGIERPHGDGTAQSLAAANERVLAEFGERGAGPLAQMITDRAGAFLDAVNGTVARGTLSTPLGPMDHATLGSYLLTHMLGHGYDLARALRRPHMIDRGRVELTLPFMTTAMPRVVNAPAAAGLTARYTIRLRGGAAFGVAFTDGTPTVGKPTVGTPTVGTPSVGTPPGRPDCTILIEPVTFLLMALGRREPWGAIASGRILAWGRKPWLAPRFPTLFTAP